MRTNMQSPGALMDLVQEGVLYRWPIPMVRG
jgi:hypothetical protein